MQQLHAIAAGPRRGSRWARWCRRGSCSTARSHERGLPGLCSNHNRPVALPGGADATNGKSNGGCNSDSLAWAAPSSTC